MLRYAWFACLGIKEKSLVTVTITRAAVVWQLTRQRSAFCFQLRDASYIQAVVTVEYMTHAKGSATEVSMANQKQDNTEVLQVGRVGGRDERKSG